MMSDKKRRNRDAKGQVMIMLSAIGEDKKKELIEQYKLPDQTLKLSDHTCRCLIGNWFNNAVKLVQKGASEDEINRVLEHLVVLLGTTKLNLNYTQSYKDHNLLEISRKYLGEDKLTNAIGEIKMKEKPLKSEERIDYVKIREKERLRAKLKILNLQDEGLTIEEIAAKFGKPESTIRAILEAK